MIGTITNTAVNTPPDDEHAVLMDDTTAISIALLIEALPDALFIVDSRGVILLVNAQAEWLTGRPRNELVGMSVDDLVPDSLRKKHFAKREAYTSQPYVRTLSSGGATGACLTLVRKSGEEIGVDVNLAPLMTTAGLCILATVRRSKEKPRQKLVARK